MKGPLCPKSPEIPPTAVGGSFKYFLNQLRWRLWNPTNGSWWIVQVLSKKGFEVSTHCRGWDSVAFRRAL